MGDPSSPRSFTQADVGGSNLVNDLADRREQRIREIAVVVWRLGAMSGHGRVLRPGSPRIIS
jgi:hypothetical protein